MSPKQSRKYFEKQGWKQIIGFQTRNPLHRSHFELTKYAMNSVKNSKLFLQPVIGETQNDDIDYITRVKCYENILKYYNKEEVKLSLLPLSMRMAGPREALLHALIRKNYGCTHFIVGRDHAGPSCKTKEGKSFFGDYDAQKILLDYKDVIDIEPLFFPEIVYTIPKNNFSLLENKYLPINLVNSEEREILRISGTELRNKLRNKEYIPEWFSFKEVINILQQSQYYKNGLCLYFVGLSGSGKSTLANYISSFLKIKLDREVTILDGDIIRKNLSKGLGFSKEDRSLNVRRIGFVASEIAKHNGCVIVANIAPYQEDRDYNRKIISENGKYIEIFVDTPIKLCIKRDVKGLYKKALDGDLKNFTGITSDFEIPTNSEIRLDGNDSINDNIDKIIEYIYNLLNESNQSYT